MRNELRVRRGLWALASAALVLTLGDASAASATVIWSQPFDGTSLAVVAQDFADIPTYSSYEFDDFVWPSGWRVTGATIFGQEFGNPNLNTGVHLRIQDNASFTSPGTIHLDVLGLESAGNLVFSFPSVVLGSGTYWISAWVDRPFGNGGGQWFWDRTTSTSNGSEHFVQNPGGAFGWGTSPIPGSSATTNFGPPEDLAFNVTGSVPEPTSLMLLGAGLAGLAFRRRRL